MSNEPICLIQWLESNDKHHETEIVLKSFANKVDIFHRDISTKAQAEQALKKWFEGSQGNCQHCFIGTHGIKEQRADKTIGIGASETEFVNWKELWEWFGQAHLIGGLWLGACNSSDAAAALSPFLTAQLAIPYIYGFSGNIVSDEIEPILSKLIEYTDINNFPWLHEELAQLRAAVPDTKVEMFYPACTLSGTREYVIVDDMRKKVGVEFCELLEQKGIH